MTGALHAPRELRRPVRRRADMTASRRRLGFILVFVAGGIFVGAGVARADCIGPTYSHTGGDLAHGDLLTVTGYGFGDNCYDTGPPPPGEGSLGRPLTGIEVYMEQGGRLHLVAVGNADQDYLWKLEVPIPTVLGKGEAHVVVMSNGFEAFREDPPEIWVTSAPVEASIEPVTFGPTGLEPPEPNPDEGFAGTNWTPLIALVAIAITTPVLVLARRRSTR